VTAYDDTRLQAVRIIESLRSGVPTLLSTREMPDLRPELVNTIRGDLDSFAEGRVPPGRLVWGQYGQGKSHLLITVGHLALEMGFAVSFVSLSREVSCHNLLHFYQRVAPALRTPDSKVPGLQVQLASRKPSDLTATPIQDPERYNHRWPAVVLELIFHCGGDDEDYYSLYNDLMGYRLPVTQVRHIAQRVGLGHLLRDLPRFRQEHAQAYFGVLADVVRWCGYKGWVILIDEVELIARLGKVGRLHAYSNLHWLLNWANDMPYPIYLLVASATSLQELWYGKNGRRRPDRVAIPELAEVRLAPEAARRMHDFFDLAASHNNPTIGPVPREAVFPLLEHLVELHARAYDWNPPPAGEWVREVTSSLPEDTKLRTYIRYVLEALDQLLLTGKTPQLEVERLSEPHVNEDEGFFVSEEDDSPQIQTER